MVPLGLFAFGFYAQDIGFKVGIWPNHSKTVVWTANRDDPPITSGSTLELTRDGKLVLRTEHGEKKQIAKTLASAASASMLDCGNFVLYNNDSEIIWETFAFPTDTILGGQNLSIGGTLVSSVSNTDSSTGQYQLKMHDEGVLVGYPLVGIWDSVQNFIEIIASRKTHTHKETQYLTWFGIKAYVHERVIIYHYTNGEIT